MSWLIQKLVQGDAMEWEWSKYNPQDLARFVTDKANEFLRLPESRVDLTQRQGRRPLLEVIYNSLVEKKIQYAPEKYHPSAAKQRIRTPAEILNAPGEGTCLDLAILFCGLCLGNDLLPVLIVLEGHALVAVSLNYGLREWDDYREEKELFQHSPLKDFEELKRLIDDEAYLTIECTGFAYSKSLPKSVPEGVGRTEEGILPFERAVAAGCEQLDHRKLQYAFDIAIAHHEWKIEPLEIPKLDVRHSPKIDTEPEIERAKNGELLIVIAQFYCNNNRNVTGPTLRRELKKQLDKADLRNVRVEWLQKTIFNPNDDNKVRDFADQYGALLVIWGYYDETFFYSNFTLNFKFFYYHNRLNLNDYSQIAKKLQSTNNIYTEVKVDNKQKLLPVGQYLSFFTLGYLYYLTDRTGNGEEAEKALKGAINIVVQDKNKEKKLDPSQQGELLAPAYFYLGNLYAVIRQDRQAAIQNYRKVLEVDGGSAQAAYNLGQSLRVLANSYRTDAQNAKQNAKQAIEDMKKTAFNLNNLLRILSCYYHYQCYEYRAKDAYRQAIRAYSKCIVINPEYVLAYQQRGLANWEIGHNKAAVKDYKSALKLRSAKGAKGRPETYYRLGLALKDLGLKLKQLNCLNCPYLKSKELSYLDQALEYFDLALRYAQEEAIDSESKSRYYMTRGYLHESRGKKEKAIEDWIKYLRLCPPNHKYRDKVKATLAQYGVQFDEES